MKENACYLTISQTATHLGVTRQTLLSWRKRGTGPRYTRFGPRVVYVRSAVEKYPLIEPESENR